MKPGIIIAHSTELDTGKAVQNIFLQIQSHPGHGSIHGGIVYSHIMHDTHALQKELSKRIRIPYIGVTSSFGTAVTYSGFSLEHPIISSMWFYGDCKFGLAGCEKSTNHDQIGHYLRDTAFCNAGLSNEDTNFLIYHSTPGSETGILNHIFEGLNPRTLVIGGSASDNNIQGDWKVFSSDQVFQNGAVLAAGFWPYKMAFKFRSGYTPTRKRGIITKAKERILYEINHRPAAVVYNEWLDGILDDDLQKSSIIIEKTALTPLAVTRHEELGLTAYVLIHPRSIELPDQSLTLFADVREGEEIVLMRSFKKLMIERAGRTASLALNYSSLRPRDVEAALVFYCAGTMMTIKNEVKEMLDGLEFALQGSPYLVAFTLGEQGCLFPGKVDHGNLMNCMLIFSKIEN